MYICSRYYLTQKFLHFVAPFSHCGVLGCQPACLPACVYVSFSKSSSQFILSFLMFVSMYTPNIENVGRRLLGQLAGWMVGRFGWLAFIAFLRLIHNFFLFCHHFFLGLEYLTLFSTNIHFYTEIITYMHVCIFCIQIFFTTFSLLFDGRFAVFLFFINKFSNLFVSSIRTPKNYVLVLLITFFVEKFLIFHSIAKICKKKEIFSQ